jgi:hypothetical protein
MNTLEMNRVAQKTHKRRPKRPSGLYMMPLVGGALCKAVTTSRARKKIQTSEVPQIKGIRAFARAAEETMMNGGQWNGSLPEVRSRARLSAYYAKRIAEKCVEIGMSGADGSLVSLMHFISPYTSIGLYFIPKEMTRYEDFFGNPLPANLRTGLRGYPSLSLEFLRRFDDNGRDFERAKAMMEYQNVAYDGKGSYYSPSYPSERKGSELPLEVQITKLVNTFSAVLIKLIKTDKNPDNPEHTNLAAATMVSVSGKDVNPKLTAALLSAIYPQTNFDEAMLLVEMLKHPDQSELEKKPGSDMEYAKKLLSNPIFRKLEFAELRAQRIAAKKAEREKRREQKRQEREMRELEVADTAVRNYKEIVKEAALSRNMDAEYSGYEEDTVPERDWAKEEAN